MPFKSQKRGELPKGTAHRWAKHTKNIKSLPEHTRKMGKKAALEVLGITEKYARLS